MRFNLDEISVLNRGISGAYLHNSRGRGLELGTDPAARRHSDGGGAGGQWLEGSGWGVGYASAHPFEVLRC